MNIFFSKFYRKYTIILITFIFYLFHLITTQAFPKIQKRLENLSKELKFLKNDIEINYKTTKSEFFNELIKERFLSMRRHSAITEYLGVKRSDITKFIDNLIRNYHVKSIPNVKKYLEDQMEDIFYASNNDLVYEKVIMEGGINSSDLLILFGESTPDREASNWLVINVSGFTIIDGVDLKEEDNKSILFGIFSYSKTQYQTVLTNISQEKIDVYNKFFEYLALEKSMDYFKITDKI